jgi:ABC-type sulfate transport system permease component
MNKSKIGGILVVISGLLGVLWGILLLVNLQYAYIWAVPLAGGIIELALGLFCVVTGGLIIYRSRFWGLALAGSIVGVFTFFPTAIAAIVLLALVKKPQHLAAAPA